MLRLRLEPAPRLRRGFGRLPLWHPPARCPAVLRRRRATTMAGDLLVAESIALGPPCWHDALRSPPILIPARCEQMLLLPKRRLLLLRVAVTNKKLV